MHYACFYVSPRKVHAFYRELFSTLVTPFKFRLIRSVPNPRSQLSRPQSIENPRRNAQRQFPRVGNRTPDREPCYHYKAPCAPDPASILSVPMTPELRADLSDRRLSPRLFNRIELLLAYRLADHAPRSVRELHALFEREGIKRRDVREVMGKHFELVFRDWFFYATGYMIPGDT